MAAANQDAAKRQALLALARYAEFHFAREEEVLATCAYESLDSHRQEHQAFATRIRDLSQSAQRGDAAASSVNRELIDYFNDWLRHHVLIIDMGYRPLVEGNRKAREAARSFTGSQVWWCS